ncbi:hypothetical protein [Rivularia sp. PCC 7116]|uniref:hypothetical protein n=1 Tax=Rivularia sp. PCC 7116 TaxID=373994 RepID=UPI000311EBF8|nr:hypothetical protein [Rivularia sp. PCC 7116]
MRTKYKGNVSSVELLPCFRSDAIGLRHVAKTLHSELHSGLWGELHVEALVNRLVELILLYHSNLECQRKGPKGKLSRVRLNEIFEYIDTNLAYTISLENLANTVDIDKLTFNL